MLQSDEKLIIVVSTFHCLYDISFDSCSDNFMWNEAYRKVAEIAGNDDK